MSTNSNFQFTHSWARPQKVKFSLEALTSLKKPQQPNQRIKRYQTYPVIDGDEDPLKWWQRNEVETGFSGFFLTVFGFVFFQEPPQPNG
jgi:hypothetical protein